MIRVMMANVEQESEKFNLWQKVVVNLAKDHHANRSLAPSTLSSPKPQHTPGGISRLAESVVWRNQSFGGLSRLAVSVVWRTSCILSHALAETRLTGTFPLKTTAAPDHIRIKR